MGENKKEEGWKMQSVTEGRRLIQLGGPRPAQKISEKSQNSSEKDSMYYILLPDAVQPQLASTKKKGARVHVRKRFYIRKTGPPCCWMNVTGIFLFSFNTNIYSIRLLYLQYNFAGKMESRSRPFFFLFFKENVVVENERN